MTNVTPLTIPYTPEMAIEELHESLECIAADLNDVIVGFLGEDAAWENHVGSTVVPSSFGLQSAWMNKLWASREEANSIIDWTQQKLEDAAEVAG